MQPNIICRTYCVLFCNFFFLLSSSTLIFYPFPIVLFLKSGINPGNSEQGGNFFSLKGLM